MGEWVASSRKQLKAAEADVSAAMESCVACSEHFGGEGRPEGAIEVFRTLMDFASAFHAAHRKIVTHLRQRRSQKRGEGKRARK